MTCLTDHLNHLMAQISEIAAVLDNVQLFIKNYPVYLSLTFLWFSNVLPKLYLQISCILRVFPLPDLIIMKSKIMISSLKRFSPIINSSEFISSTNRNHHTCPPHNWNPSTRNRIGQPKVLNHRPPHSLPTLATYCNTFNFLLQQRQRHGDDDEDADDDDAEWWQ